MKKLLTLIILILCSSAIFAQSLFKPVPKDLFAPKNNVNTIMGVAGAVVPQNASKWLLRAQVAITAIQINLKSFETSNFSNAGVGIGWQHYIPGELEPFNDYGFNILLLGGKESPSTDLPTNKFSFSVAVVANALGWINLGPIYDTRSNTIGILTGVSLKF